MDFFDQFMEYFDNEDIRQELLAMIIPDDEQNAEKMITGHFSDDGQIVFSVFSMEEWEMIKEMSIIVDKEIEDIIKDLGPDEVPQLWIRPDKA